jgi:hypothetical protein
MLVMQIQQVVKSTAVPWWQVISGILAIPAALLGLMYTYRLYQKTNIEIRERYLSILEKERALGVAKPSLIVVEEGFSKRRRRESATLTQVPDRKAWRWAAVATAAFMTTVLLLVTYSSLRSIWTVTIVYHGLSESESVRVVVGSELTPEGKDLLSRGMFTPEDIVRTVGLDDIDAVWTERSIRLRRVALAILRWLTVFSAIVSLASGFYLLTRRRLHLIRTRIPRGLKA